MTISVADHLRMQITPSLVVTPHSTAMRTAAALLDDIDALHRPHPSAGGDYCRSCRTLWPCPTARLLHPEDGRQ